MRASSPGRRPQLSSPKPLPDPPHALARKTFFVQKREVRQRYRRGQEDQLSAKKARSTAKIHPKDAVGRRLLRPV